MPQLIYSNYALFCKKQYVSDAGRRGAKSIYAPVQIQYCMFRPLNRFAYGIDRKNVIAHVKNPVSALQQHNRPTTNHGLPRFPVPVVGDTVSTD